MEEERAVKSPFLYWKIVFLGKTYSLQRSQALKKWNFPYWIN